MSYAREDRERARVLAQALQSCGWSVWWDPEILPGETWDEVIERELAAARCVVVLWSSRSIGKRWVRTEASHALQREVLVPVMIEKEVTPPLAFLAIQAAPLSDWQGEGEHRGFQQLVNAIRRAAYRIGNRPDDCNRGLGLRCAQEP